MSKPIKVMLGASSAMAMCLAATMSLASSHREAPGITEQPKIDATDFYMFRSYEPGRSDYVTFIANYQPDQSPYGGPNYYTMDPDAVYQIHIDNNGDAVEDFTFSFDFDNNLLDGTGFAPTIGGVDVAIPLRQFGGITAADRSGFLNETETYFLSMITGDRRSGVSAPVIRSGSSVNSFAKAVDYIGTKTFPDYEAYAETFFYDMDIPGCDTDGKVFVGQRAEAFAVNLGNVFDLVNLVPLQGPPNPLYPQYNVTTPFPGGIMQDRANDDLVGEANVTSIAIEVPIECVTAGTDPVIGAWTTTSLPQGEVEDPSPTYEATSVFGGAWVQQSRLSNPLVNELVIGLPDKDLFNAAEPTQDPALAVYVTNPTLPFLLDLLFRDAVGSPSNIAPVVDADGRDDLVAAFLTGFTGPLGPFNASSNPSAVGSEMMRLNTAVPVTLRDDQHTFGLVAEDLAGFPNGRRPGDDTVDIALRVVMGALCHPVPLGAELTANPAIEDTPDDLVNLGFCDPADAPVGNQPFTDGAPLNASELRNSFPYLNTPLPGSGS